LIANSGEDYSAAHTIAFIVDTSEKQLFMFDSNGSSNGLVDFMYKGFRNLQGKGKFKDWRWLDVPCPSINVGEIKGVSHDGMCSWYSILFTCLCLDNPNLSIQSILDYMMQRTSTNKEFILNFMFRFIYLLDTKNVEPFNRVKKVLAN